MTWGLHGPWQVGDRVSRATALFLRWDLEEAHHEYCRRRAGQLHSPAYHGDTLQAFVNLPFVHPYFYFQSNALVELRPRLEVWNAFGPAVMRQLVGEVRDINVVTHVRNFVLETALAQETQDPHNSVGQRHRWPATLAWSLLTLAFSFEFVDFDDKPVYHPNSKVVLDVGHPLIELNTARIEALSFALFACLFPHTVWPHLYHCTRRITRTCNRMAIYQAGLWYAPCDWPIPNGFSIRTFHDCEYVWFASEPWLDYFGHESSQWGGDSSNYPEFAAHLRFRPLLRHPYMLQLHLPYGWRRIMDPATVFEL
jgi:hypothetical protein